MKKLIVISPGRTTAINLAMQLEKFFGEYSEISAYCLEDEFNFDISNSLVVISSREAIDDRIKLLMDKGMDYILARRVINHRYIGELLNLPKATEVLLVNDRKETTFLAISQLQALGVNNIKYYPYYPGMISYPKLDIAVTVGEPHLVPYRVKRVIDIGTRQFDVTTLIDIAHRLGLMDVIGDSLSSHYIHEIVGLLNRISDVAKETRILSNRLQTVANCISKAIIYVNKEGNVLLVNNMMTDLLSCKEEDIIGRDIKDVLPVLAKIDKTSKSDIIKIKGKELFVTQNVVEGKGIEEGKIYIFEKSEDIQKNEHEIRRRASYMAIKGNYYTVDDIIYKSENMKKFMEKVKAFANTDSTILIQGESGTGKELIAQTIHSLSKRAKGPFVPVNFASLNMNLIESELFGYEEGSFTGALKGGKIGLFEQAHGGTIFLDEIGDASLEFQCTLLRVIQERQIRRIGGLMEIPVDVRIIAATNKNLAEEVKRGKFRSDLYYRLNVLPIKVPSLRERKSDIPLLANYFIEKYSNGRSVSLEDILEEDAIRELYEYDWPGNVRQLENAIEYIISLAKPGKKIQKNELPDYIADYVHSPQNSVIIDVLGKDMIWVLGKMKNSDGIGRRYLAKCAEEENIDLTEGQIRNILNLAQSMGLIESKPGRGGSHLTEKGYNVIAMVDREINGL
ncbi:MAG TPA: sigma 54-interacting transcriptional regulator [Tissierellia bacterium]|nr:sigma 54-interacting transcriptional regulator [Tissierellia bacterium]